MSATRCPECRNGFVEDHTHPTEFRLTGCQRCDGTGRIPEQSAPDFRVDDEIDRRKLDRHFGDQHAEGRP